MTKIDTVFCTNCGEPVEDKNGDELTYCPDCQENNDMGDEYGQ